ncbi:hypothetical protein [Streptomyces hiroshimensis]|uniref:Ricin B lectin domain-containing protein n=1 Tax=Streptomyces hiroshimensis TaxID=66424 RepID=A0ABQ2Y7S2_9ACTN|nr:hypothetical protein [Streptomyces hiroshimensis]GGX73214.1 hypothetical protein GCM10010324_18060 [Streptomyces hiroshimensis]
MSVNRSAWVRRTARTAALGAGSAILACGFAVAPCGGRSALAAPAVQHRSDEITDGMAYQLVPKHSGSNPVVDIAGGHNAIQHPLNGGQNQMFVVKRIHKYTSCCDRPCTRTGASAPGTPAPRSTS